MDNERENMYPIGATQPEQKRRGFHISTVDVGTILSAKAYNAILAGLLLYGFLANVLLCTVFAGPIHRINPMVLIGGYFVAALAGTFVANLSKSAFTRFIGFNLVVVPSGMIVATVLPSYYYGTVVNALLGTALIAVVMLAIAIVRPQTFEGLGTALLFSLLTAVVVETVLLFLFHSSNFFIDLAVIIIMACFIGFDFLQANRVTRTASNAVAFALNLYMDMLNIFIRLLSILGRRD